MKQIILMFVALVLILLWMLLASAQAPPILATVGDSVLTGATFSSDNSKLIVTTGDGLEIWDISRGTQIDFKKIPGILGCTLDPTGHYLALAFSNRLEIWDAAKLSFIRAIPYEGIPKMRHNVRFSPNGKLVALSCYVKVWRVDTGTMVFSSDKMNLVDGLYFLNDETLAIAKYPDISILNIKTNATRLLGKEHYRHLIAVQPKINSVAYMDTADNLVIANTETSDKVRLSSINTGTTGWFGFSPDKKFLIISGVFKNKWGIIIFNLDEDRVVATFSLHSTDELPWEGFFSNDGTKVGLIYSDNLGFANVTLLDLKHLSKLQDLSNKWSAQPITGIVSSADGQHIILNYEKRLEIWSVQSSSKVSQHPTVAATNIMASSPTSMLVAVGSYFDNRVSLWDWKDDHEFTIQLRPKLARCSALAFTPDGEHLAIGHADGTLTVWDWRRYERIETIKTGSRIITSIAISPDGKLIAAAESNNSQDESTLGIWNVKTGTLVDAVPDVRAVQLVFKGPQELVIKAGKKVRPHWWSQPQWQLLSLDERGKVLKTQQLGVNASMATFMPGADTLISLKSSAEQQAAELMIWPIKGGVPLQSWEIRPWASITNFIEPLLKQRAVAIGTPFTKITIFNVNLPPRIISVSHQPEQVRADQRVRFTVKAIDPEGGPLLFLWNIEGNTQTSSNVIEHIYKSTGTYTVRVTAIDDSGATTTYQQTVLVKPSQCIDFSFMPSNPFVMESVLFIDQSTGDIQTRTWTFGDGKTATGTCVQHQFKQPGTYSVTLGVRYKNGAEDQRQKTITARPASYIATIAKPLLEVVLSPADQPKAVLGAVVHIIRRVATTKGVTTLDVGEGKISLCLGSNAIITLTQSNQKAGIKVGDTVIFVQNNGGQPSQTIKTPVKGNPEQRIRASFAFSPEKPTLRDSVNFTDQSSDLDGQIVGWNWNFGDGTSATEENPTHLYRSKGQFTVTLTVTDASGSSDTVTRKLTVVNIPPTARFTFKPSLPMVNQPVTFDATLSHDDDGEIIGEAWDFNGDGKADAHGAKVRWIFTKEGNHTVTLTVMDNDGSKSSQQISINVQNASAPSLQTRSSHLPLPQGAIARLGKGILYGARFSPDGKYLVIETSLGLEIRDAKTLEIVSFLKSGMSRSFSFSPDGSLLAVESFSWDGNSEIDLWDVTTGEKVRAFTGHIGQVNSMAFSPDGRFLVSGSEDHIVTLWNTTTGKEVYTITNYTGPVYSVAFSPDGKLIASGSWNKTMIWNVITEKPVHTFTSSTSPVYSVAFSPDGKLLASGSDDTLVLWNVATGERVHTFHDVARVGSVVFSPDGQLLAFGSGNNIKVLKVASGALVRVLQGHSDLVRSVSFSSDAQVIVSSSYDHTIRLWNVDTGKELYTLNGYTSCVNTVAFSPTGKFLASGSWDNTIRIWDMVSGKTAHILKDTRVVNCVAFSPNGDLIASASGSSDRGTIKVWNVVTGKLVHTLNNPTSRVDCVLFSPDGKLLASGDDKTVKLWDVATGNLVRTIESCNGSVTFSPDGKLLASTCKGNMVKVWKVSTGYELYALRIGNNEAASVAFSPDGKLLATGSVVGVIKLWGMSTGKELATLEDHYGNVAAPALVTFSRDGRLLASGSWDGTVLWDVATREELCILNGHAGPVTSVTFSPDGKFLASGSTDGTVLIWSVSQLHLKLAPEAKIPLPQGAIARLGMGSIADFKFSPNGRYLGLATSLGIELRSTETLNLIQFFQDNVDTVAFSPSDDDLMASGSINGTIKLRKITTGTLVRTITSHGSVHSLAFSPNGKLLASQSHTRNEITLWNVNTGEKVYTLTGHTDTINSMAFSPDGKYLASGSSDRTVKLWDVTTGQEIYTLNGHDAWVESVAFSPDSNLLASGDADGVIKLWNVLTGREVRTITSEHGGWVSSIAFSPNGKTLAVGRLWDHTVEIWDIATGTKLRTIRCPGGNVSLVAFSPNGEILASKIGSRLVQLWQVTTGDKLRTITSNAGYIHSIVFSPDGKVLASGGSDGTVKLWGARTGSELRVLKGHTASVYSVAFSPDGKLIASGSWDKTIKIWNVSTGKLVHTITGHTASVYSVAFSPDGKLLASGSGDKAVKIWNVSTGKLVHTISGHTNKVTAVVFSPNGKLLASASNDKTIKLWDVSTGRLVYSLTGHTGAVTSIAFSPDGKLLASGSDDHTIKLWDVATGKLIYTLTGHTASVYSITFSPDGGIIASGSLDKTLKLWDASTGQELITYNSGLIPCTIAFSSDGQLLALGSQSGVITLRKVAKGELVRTLTGHTEALNTITFSPSGKLLASGYDGGVIKLWNVATKQEFRTLISSNASINSVAFNPQKAIIASGDADGTIRLWDIVTGKEVRVITINTPTATFTVESVAFSPDGKLIAAGVSGINNYTVKIWDADTGKLVRTIVGYTNEVESVTFSPNGEFIASGSDSTVKLWNVATGELIRTIICGGNEVGFVAFSPDGKLLASASYDGTIKLWDVTTGKNVHTFAGAYSTASVAFSPDGKVISSGASNKTVRLWDVATGKTLCEFPGSYARVSMVAFAPDGKTLASGSWDNTIILWDISQKIRPGS